jgi:hypothetical protein
VGTSISYPVYQVHAQKLKQPSTFFSLPNRVRIKYAIIAYYLQCLFNLAIKKPGIPGSLFCKYDLNDAQ